MKPPISSVPDKLQMLNKAGEAEKIFPFNHLLSKEIEPAPLQRSFLVQPPVYLRLRPGKAQKVKETFLKAGFRLHIVHETCLAVNNNTKVDQIVFGWMEMPSYRIGARKMCWKY